MYEVITDHLYPNSHPLFKYMLGLSKIPLNVICPIVVSAVALHLQTPRTSSP